MENYKIKLNRSLSIKYCEKTNVIHVGINPPGALEIYDAPDCLVATLNHLNQPKEVNDVIGFITANYGYEEIDAKKIINDLLSTNIVIKDYPMTRYDRHELFFSLQGVAPESYQSIVSNLKVGLIGMGGIGSVCSMLLAAAGIGALVISDEDEIEESNLTRALLYNELHIGYSKVNIAYSELTKRNSNCKITTIAKEMSQQAIENKGWLHQYFSQCDFIILSADIPFDIHHYVNKFCLQYNIPNLNVGYIEAVGAIGPLFIPGKTACFECEYQQTLSNDKPFKLKELNQHLQAPSFGPLNAYVSSIAVNELLRHFFNLKPITTEKKLLIDFTNYEMNTINIEKAEGCICR